MKYSLFFLFFLFLGVLATQTISTEQQTRLDSLVQMDVRLGSPGVAVGIVHNGKIIYENYAGLADLETEVLIDGSTRFNIASNAKQFTAICVLQLAEQGLLSLSDDIRKYLPELYPDVRDPIT
ncbi:MAG: serine hydrolase domain-containing protein, partial [Bacteroidota bacterium]